MLHGGGVTALGRVRIGSGLIGRALGPITLARRDFAHHPDICDQVGSNDSSTLVVENSHSLQLEAIMTNTKIIATLGPASSSTECVRGLLSNGVSVFRINASHGTWSEHVSNIQRVRQTGEEFGRDAAILLDLQGPKIRLGIFEGGGCTLETGSSFTSTVEHVLGNKELASDYRDFAKDVKPGDSVFARGWSHRATGSCIRRDISAVPRRLWRSYRRA